jgi:hypothetical protein
MALPTSDDLYKLDYGLDGVAFVRVTGNSSITTEGLTYGLDGVAFLAATSPLGAPVGQSGYVTLGVMG